MALLTLPLLAVSLALAAPPSVQSLRDESEAVIRIQSVLSWHTAVDGEPSILALTYKGHERLFSAESVRTLARELKRKDLSDDDRRALEFLKSYLATSVIDLQTAHFDDEAQNAQLHATVVLPGDSKPTAFKDLDVLIQTEPNAKRRANIDAARGKFYRDTLNPILERKEQANLKLARELGYPSYFKLAEEAKRLDIRALLEQGHAWLLRTDVTFKQLLGALAQSELGIPEGKLRRADLKRLLAAPKEERFFPRELTVPAFKFFLSGIGLDMKTAAGTQIHVDDAITPLKEPRAACYPIHVPDDVRITVKPSPGLEDYATFFHEGGHALHFANTTSKRMEFQFLGPNALTEGYAEMFAKVWADPLWLRHYRDFVRQHNATQKTHFPVMTDADIQQISRVSVLRDFYLMRRYGSAKLIFESVLHGADPAVWKKSFTAPTADLKAVYRATFAEAYGLPLDENDALRFRVDVDPLFYAADYARAFLLGDTLNESFRQRYGGSTGDWYTNKDAGKALRALYAEGQKPDTTEVAEKLGFASLGYGPSEARTKRILALTPSVETAMSFFDLKANRLDGKPEDLSHFKGKVVLVVNTASECGFTPQYAGLEKLYEDYKDKGLVVVGFPSNDFGAQEPGSSEEIAKFCDLRFKVKFPLFEKVVTKGPGQSPVYAFLTQGHGEPKWNFHKYLVGKDGQVKNEFPSKVTPESAELRTAIDQALGAK